MQQHSLVSSWSSECSRGLVRLRRQSRALCRRVSPGLLAGSGVAAAAGVAGGSAARAILASSAAAGGGAGLPDFGRDGKKKQRSSGPLDFGSALRRCTDSLLVLNAALFLANWASKDMLMLWGAKVNSLIAAGQLWRLVTCNLMHTSAIHLLINSHALATIGPHAELLLGHSRFMAVYVTGALAGTAASYLLTPLPSVGASAALFGLGASLGVFYWRHRHSMGRRSEVVLQQLGLTLAINMAYSLMSKRIDNWGHAGGMLGGALVTWLLGPRLVRDKSGVIVDQPPIPILAHKHMHGPSMK